MRYPILAVVFAGLFVATEAIASERYKITNDRRQVIGDVYCPGHGRRCQIRDNRLNIRGYIEADGDITLPNRKKVKEIELDKK